MFSIAKFSILFLVRRDASAPTASGMAMQVTGKAQIIEPFSDEYVAAAEFKKIPIDALKKLPQPMHLIRVTPVKAEMLNSEFKKDGFASRQKIV